MPYKSLSHWIAALEKAGELVRISEYVNPELEIAEITDRVSKTPGQNKALLFENTGTAFPLLINSMGSEKRMCMALGVDHLDDVARNIESLFKTVTTPKNGLLEKLSMLPTLGKFAGWMPKVVSGRGACQEVTMTNPDLAKIPVLKCWPHDGGPFITLPAIHTKDPHSGQRNIGMYRMQVFEKDLAGLHWHKHKVSAKHFNEYKKAGIKKMPVAVALGGDPIFTYAATAPLPENVDEYMLAGFLRQKRVELVKCITQPEIEVPADADIILEGYVDVDEDLIWEGPFGDHTGYYSLPDWYPRFHLTAITHRRDAVYPATIVGIPPQEDAWLGKATERIFLAPIKMTMVPEIKDMNMPVEGVFHNLVLASIEKDYPGQAAKVMNAMWGAGQMMFNKILVITDAGVDLNDYKALAQYVFQNLTPDQDIYFSQGPMDVLDHSCTRLGYGGKMCIDGTKKLEEEQGLEFGIEHWGIGFEGQDGEAIAASFAEIVSIGMQLWEKMNIPVMVVSVRKGEGLDDVRTLHQKLCTQPEVVGLKMILYVEETVDPKDTADVLWRLCNNMDPRRDHFFGTSQKPDLSYSEIRRLQSLTGEATSTAKHSNSAALQPKIIGLDGTRKTAQDDGFPRDWPNIIAADAATIAAVDAKWARLGVGPFIKSPSLKYQTQLYPGGHPSCSEKGNARIH